MRREACARVVTKNQPRFVRRQMRPPSNRRRPVWSISLGGVSTPDGRLTPSIAAAGQRIYSHMSDVISLSTRVSALTGLTCKITAHVRISVVRFLLVDNSVHLPASPVPFYIHSLLRQKAAQIIYIQYTNINEHMYITINRN